MQEYTIEVGKLVTLFIDSDNIIREMSSSKQFGAILWQEDGEALDWNCS